MTDQPETFDRAYVDKLRKEAARHRAEAREATAQLEQANNQIADLAEQLRGANEHVERTDRENLATRLVIEHDLDPSDIEHLLLWDNETMPKAAARFAGRSHAAIKFQTKTTPTTPANPDAPSFEWQPSGG